MKQMLKMQCKIRKNVTLKILLFVFLLLLFTFYFLPSAYAADDPNRHQSDLTTVNPAAADTVTGLQGGVNVNFAWGANLTALKGLTFVDASIIQLTGAGAAAVLTSGGNHYFLKSTSDNSAIEFATPANALAAIGAQAIITYPVTGVASPTAGYLTKWGVSGNAIVDGPKLGTLTDAKWCSFSTANGLQCTENAPGAGGYTNLTSFIDQTAWRVFYSDGSGDVKELALGSDGTYLRSNGASSAPTFDTPSGAAHDALTLDTTSHVDDVFSLSTQRLDFDTQTANYVFAGPNTGAAAAPTFRALVSADIPANAAATSSSAASLSVSGQTGLMTVTGITSTNRAKTVRDAADTILELGGSYTPTGTWTWSGATWASVPTLNQNTSGTAANLSGTPALPNGTTATTQAAADNSTKLATTAYANALVSDTAYDATSWDGVTAIAASKNAVRDYLESKIPAGADGSYRVVLTNNTAISPTASVDEIYFEANIAKVNQNGTESSMAIGPTGTQINFSGTLTNGKICTFATGGAISCNTDAGAGDFKADGTVAMTGVIAANAGITSTNSTATAIDFRDSDVTHGITTIGNTNSWYLMNQANATKGGAQIHGFSDTSDQSALLLKGYMVADPDDTVSAVKIVGYAASGTGVTALAAAEEVFQVYNNTTVMQTVYGNGNTTIAGDVTVSGGDIILPSATAGARLTGGNGLLTIKGEGDGTDEDLTINLNSANVATVSSSTGVTDLNLSALNLVTTGNISGNVAVIDMGNTAATYAMGASDAYGKMFLQTHGDAATDVTLPDYQAAAAADHVKVGSTVCIMTLTAYPTLIHPSADDKIRTTNGTLNAAGVGVTGPTTLGAYTCFMLTDSATDVGHWTQMGLNGAWAAH